jgi:hypothetical protein
MIGLFLNDDYERQSEEIHPLFDVLTIFFVGIITTSEKLWNIFYFRRVRKIANSDF